MAESEFRFIDGVNRWEVSTKNKTGTQCVFIHLDGTMGSYGITWRKSPLSRKMQKKLRFHLAQKGVELPSPPSSFTGIDGFMRGQVGVLPSIPIENPNGKEVLIHGDWRPDGQDFDNRVFWYGRVISFQEPNLLAPGLVTLEPQCIGFYYRCFGSLSTEYIAQSNVSPGQMDFLVQGIVADRNIMKQYTPGIHVLRKGGLSGMRKLLLHGKLP